MLRLLLLVGVWVVVVGVVVVESVMQQWRRWRGSCLWEAKLEWGWEWEWEGGVKIDLLVLRKYQYRESFMI